MRVLLPVVAACFLVLALAPASVAHVAHSGCHPDVAVPTTSSRILPPGETLSYWSPAGFSIDIVASGPLDLAFHSEPDCTLDPACHHHGTGRMTRCITSTTGMFTIHNPSGSDGVWFWETSMKCSQIDACFVLPSLPVG